MCIRDRDTHPLDDFFRESLKDLKVAPSKNARGNFLEEAAKIRGKNGAGFWRWFGIVSIAILITTCLLYTSDAADERSSVDLGGRRIIKKKKQKKKKKKIMYINEQNTSRLT